MPEIARNVTITATTQATAQKSKIIGKKHVLIKPWRKNTGKIYVACSYEYSGAGKRTTDFETLYPEQSRLYGAPKDKLIYYLWFYSETSGNGLQYVASDGSLFGEPYGRDLRFRKFTRLSIEVVLVSETKKTITKTVPSGKKWFVYGAYLHNPDSVTRKCQIQCLKVGGDAFGDMLAWNTEVTTGDKMRVPNALQNSTYEFPESNYPLILTEGEAVSFIWEAGSASTGGTSTLTVLEYIEVDLA